jgi:GTP-binding protein HflX
VVEADILIHVIDAAHPQVFHQIDAVNQVLDEIGVHDKVIVPVFNKLDAPEAARNLVALRAHLPGAVEISALRGTGLDELREHLADLLRNRSVRVRLRIPVAEGKLLALLTTHALVHAIDYEDDVARVEASVPVTMLGMVHAFRTDLTAGEEIA